MAACVAQRLVLVPGNGGGNVRDCNFYGWAEARFTQLGYDVRLRNMPDPYYAREKKWVPFILNDLGCDASSVLVGHSSGAAAALRVAEKNRLRGMVLVAGYDSDLGDEVEQKSGYFSRPFDWDAIKSNCGFIVQFSGDEDTLVPIDVQRRLSSQVGGEYIEIMGGDHFFEPPFDRLVEAVERNLAALPKEE